MHRLRHKAEAEAGRLLRVLFLWFGAVPADSGRALGRERRGLLLCGVDKGERRYRRRHARLAAQPAHQPARVVVSIRRDGCRSVCCDSCSSCHLDYRARLDGSGLHPECKAVRPHPLPLHRTLLSRHDCAGVSACGRHRLRRIFRLVDPGRPPSCRKQSHLVGHGTRLGKILVVGHTIRYGWWPGAE